MTPWKLVQLKDCCEFKPPKAEARRRLGGDDLVSFVPMNNLGIDTPHLSLEEEKPLSDVSGSYTYFADNDVLLAKITPCFENGKLGIAQGLKNGIGFGSSEFIVLRSNESLLPKYLYYFLLRPSFREVGQSLMTGAVGHKRVPKEYIENTELPLPPVEEQQRIAAILDQAFADIDKARALTEQNLKNTRELFDSYLQQVFSTSGKSFPLVTLSEITESITDGDHSAPPKSETGIPFITISNIDKVTNTVNFADTFKVPSEYFSSLKETRRPKFGDVLFTVTGSYGIPVIVNEHREFCFQRHIGLLRPSVGIDSKWLFYLLMSPQVFQQAENGATGAAQKTVSLKVLRNISVPLMPIEVQQKVVSSLDQMFSSSKNLQDNYSSKLRSLDELKKSLLQKAFTGGLTQSENPEAAA